MVLQKSKQEALRFAALESPGSTLAHLLSGFQTKAFQVLELASPCSQGLTPPPGLGSKES